MESEDRVDRIRRAALDGLDEREKTKTRLLMVAAAVEAIGLILYLVLMDFSDRLHWLVLIAACLVYGTLTVGLFALGAEMKAEVRRILRAVEEVGRGA